MGKRLESARRAPLLWGQSVTAGVGGGGDGRGKAPIRRKGQYRGAARERCTPAICSSARCHLPLSSARQFTNNLDHAPPPSRTPPFSKTLGAELPRRHLANESCAIVSSQLAAIKGIRRKKGRRRDWVQKLKFFGRAGGWEKAATGTEPERAQSFDQTRRRTLLYCPQKNCPHSSRSFKHGST